MPAKGSSFEREICRQLSMWWTDGARDDVFWRSAASGSMATSRMRRKGKTTAGQHGDIQATDPIGKALTDFWSIELKRGYKQWSPFDVIDAKPDAAKQTFTKFVEQATEACTSSGAYAPMLIARRDRRDAVVMTPVFPQQYYENCLTSIIPSMHLDSADGYWTIMRLDDFFENVRPEWVVPSQEDKAR